MKRRKILSLLIGLLVAALLVAAVVSHWLYWYHPRVRPGVPELGGIAERLLDDPQFTMAVWLASPHQNLAQLERDAPDLVGLLEAIARLGGLPRPRLPAFGPMRVPPSSEMAFATDGERFVLVAHIHPTVALFARLAGKVARNPWLEGGEISQEGHPVEVRWEGNTWTVASPTMPKLAPPPPASTSAVEPALMLLEVREIGDDDKIPLGRFALTLDAEALELRSAGTPAAPELDGHRFAGLAPFLMAATGGGPGEARQALIFFSQSGEANDLPRVASISRTGGPKPWSLPGEGLLGLTGRDPLEATSTGWDLAALDRVSLERAEAVAVELDEVLTEADLGWGLWLDLDGGLAEVARIAGILEQVPIISRRRKEQWRDAEVVLTPLARRFSRLSVVVPAESRELHLRLVRRADGAKPGR